MLSRLCRLLREVFESILFDMVWLVVLISKCSTSSRRAWLVAMFCLLLDNFSFLFALRRSTAIYSLFCSDLSTLTVMKVSDLDSSMACTLVCPVCCLLSHSCCFGYLFSSSGCYIGLSAVPQVAFFLKKSSTLWLVLAITSVALGLPLLLPVGAFFLVGVCTSEA